MFNKTEYWAILLKAEFNSRVFIGKKKLSPTAREFKFGEKMYLVGSHAPTYIAQNKRFYFIDVDSGSQLSIDGVNPTLTPEELDLVVGQKIIREITSGVNAMNKDKIISAIFGFVFGVLLMGMVLTMYYSDKIQTLTGNVIPNL